MRNWEFGIGNVEPRSWAGSEKSGSPYFRHRNRKSANLARSKFMDSDARSSNRQLAVGGKMLTLPSWWENILISPSAWQFDPKTSRAFARLMGGLGWPKCPRTRTHPSLNCILARESHWMC